MADRKFHVLYSDIGGVLGTNGWDSALRRDVCNKFDLPAEEIDKRHLLMFDSYERGFMKFEDYLVGCSSNSAPVHSRRTSRLHIPRVRSLAAEYRATAPRQESERLETGFNQQ